MTELSIPCIIGSSSSTASWATKRELKPTLPHSKPAKPRNGKNGAKPWLTSLRTSCCFHLSLDRELGRRLQHPCADGRKRAVSDDRMVPWRVQVCLDFEVLPQYEAWNAKANAE